MPTIQQLPSAVATNSTDQIPVSQSGTTRAVTVGALLAATQPAITMPSTTLLGRASLGPGGPEVVTAGVGLELQSGILAADGADHASFPVQSQLDLTDNAVLDSSGTPMRLPLAKLRSLFSAGSNVSIDQNGTISATGTGSTLALPASAPLLSSNGSALAAVALGSNLSLTAGTLSATGPNVPTSTALLASTAQGALAPVSLSGASYANGTLSIAPYTLPAASNSALGGVRGDGATISISSLGVISATGTSTVNGTSPVTPTGAPNPVTLANLAARIVYVEDYGAVADCVLTGDGSRGVSGTDNGPAFQAAVNALGAAGGIVQMAVGHYWVNSPVTLNQGTVIFQGKGYYEGAGPTSGTWVIQNNATQGFHLFSITRSNGVGSILQNFAIFQCHPAPSGTAGTAWAPINYDYAIYFTNLYGGFTVRNIFLSSVNKGIGLFYCGHFKLDEITGQCYTTGVLIDACQDSPRIGHIRFWPYQDNNVNRITYQQQNFDALLLVSMGFPSMGRSSLLPPVPSCTASWARLPLSPPRCRAPRRQQPSVRR